MKKAWLLSAAFCAALLSGCGLTDTPNELMRAPSADGDQKSINQAVMQFLPAGSQLAVPLHPAEASAVSLQDLNGDGAPEVVAFYKSDKTDYEIGVLVLTQKQGNWQKLTSFTGIGNELDYVSFNDLTGDHIPEMLIGLGGGDGLNKELSVFSIADDKTRELMKQSYSVMAVGDLNGDQQPELALVMHDHTNFTSKAELFGAKDGKITKLTEIALDGYVNGYEQAIIGKASPTRNALFIESGVGAHSSATDLLLWENGELRNPLAKVEGEMDLTFKAYSLYSEDINGDGIIEVGTMIQPLGTEDMAMAEIPWISSYFQWDGKTGLKHVEDHYQNFAQGIDLKIPDKWRDKYSLATLPSSNSFTMRFFYYGENGKNKAELLTLQSVPQTEWNKFENGLKQKQVPYVLLKEEGKQVLIAILPQAAPNLGKSAMQEYRAMQLTADEIRQLYKPLSIP
ncbi:VCBS repeat-containing protein [Brevibacillus parabrevis]|uniref:VCBS repeat-containing protein n=1 Tax=Brevibacillus parabrevis TaxID=54914 RepID=UPI0028D90C33|nr:VCBS repeat-containing protein [Brevibacillus parabrevis]